MKCIRCKTQHKNREGEGKVKEMCAICKSITTTLIQVMESLKYHYPTRIITITEINIRKT